jgi:hypothetical protein
MINVHLIASYASIYLYAHRVQVTGEESLQIFALINYLGYCRLQKPVRFSIFGPALFFWPHFDPANHQKVIFCYCSPPR